MANYEELKVRTTTDANIGLYQGCYRFVNHEDRLATTGFKFRNTLRAERKLFLFDERTVEIMQKRYTEIFPNRIMLWQVVKIDQSTGEQVAQVASPHRCQDTARAIAANCTVYAENGFTYAVIPV